MKRNLFTLGIAFFLLILVLPGTMKATHVVGGLLTYRHLGDSVGYNKYDYRVTLKLYRNCYDGVSVNDVNLTAYSNLGTTVVRVFSPAVVPDDPLESFVDTCVVEIDNICVEEYIFETVMNLPPVAGGWHLTYDVGNRNAQIDNLVNPTNIGEGFYAFIPNDTLVIYSTPDPPPVPAVSVPLWLEDFDLGNGTTNDGGATGWTSSPGGSSDDFDVNNGEFEMDDIDNVGSWTSEWIDISGDTCHDLSVDVRERTGNELENSDYIRFYYDTGTGPIIFPINGDLSNDFTSSVAEAICVSGDSVQIYIEAANNNNDEEYYIDNVTVSPPDPVDTTIIWCEDFVLADGETDDVGATAWTTQFFGGRDYFATWNSQLWANDMDGLGQWFSEQIPVTGDTFHISVYLEEEGSLESDDYVEVYYSLDGGTTWILFDVNGSLYNDFTIDTAYALGITGATTVQIRIDFDNDSDSESHIVNGICVNSTSEAKVPIDTVSMISMGPNTSPTYDTIPPIFECAGEIFTFDHAASDLDGDSLVYYICTPYDAWNGSPWQTANDGPPPFDANGDPVIDDLDPLYVTGYSALEPFGDATIDPLASIGIDTDGLLTAYMPAVGVGQSNQYVVGVCVDEYRDDTLIGTIKRDFQFNSVYCPPQAATVIRDTAICDGATIQFPFPNGVSDASVAWDFGDPTTTADVSTLTEPSYTYPDTGTYTVRLIVNEGTPCADTAYADVTITWSRSAFFDDDPACIGAPLTFTDSSYSSNNSTVTNWSWTFGDGNVSTDQSPVHNYLNEGTYDVQLIATSDFGCADTTIHQVVVDSQVFVMGPVDTSVCQSVPGMQLSGSFSGPATGTVWRTLGDGSFTDSLDINTYYTFGPTDVATPIDTVTLLLVSTGQMCNAVIDTMLIEITVGPVVDAGLPDTVCTNSPSIVLAGSFQAPATGVTWSHLGSADGNFAPSPTIIIPTYTLGADDLTQDSIKLLITSTPSTGSCPDAIDSVTIYIVQPPTVSAGSDDTVCDNSLMTTLNATSSTGSGTWINTNGDNTGFGSITSATSSYTATTTDSIDGFAELIWCSTNNGLYCSPVCDTMILIISRSVTATAPADLTVCHNNSDFSLTGTTSLPGQSVIWTSSIPGSFTLDDSTIYTISYEPDTSNIVAPDTFEMSFCIPNPGVGCVANCDTMLVDFTPSPSISACDGCGPLDYELLCAGNCLSNLNGAFYNQADFPGSGVVWSVSYGGPRATVPDINAVLTDPTDLTTQYCPGAEETPLLPGASLQQVSISIVPTNVGNCAVVPDTANLTIVAAPLIDAGPPQEVCENNADSVSMDATANYGITSQASPPTWTGGGGGFSGDVEDAEYYFDPAEVFAGNTLNLKICIHRLCLFDIAPEVCDSMEVTFAPAPTAYAGLDQEVCSNNPLATFTGDTTSGGSNGALVFQWTNIYGVAGNVATPTAISTDYTPDASQIATGPTPPGDSTWCLEFEVSDASGYCSPVADTVCASATPAPVVEAGNDTTICDNNRAVVLNGSVTLGGNAGAWSGGTDIFLPNATSLTNVGYTPVIAANDSVTLYLCSTNGMALNNCAEVCDSMKVFIDPPPTVFAGLNDTVCTNNPNVTLNGSYNTALSTGIVWSSFAGVFLPASGVNDTIGFYQPDAAEIISNGCTDMIISTEGSGLCREVSDTMLICFSSPPTIEAGNDIPTCVNNPISSLGGTVTGAMGGQWTDPSGSGTFSQPDSLNTTYTYTANAGVPTAGTSVRIYFTSTGNGGCNSVIDSMNITYTAAPTVSVGPADTSCANNAQLTLTASMTLSTTGIWSGFNGGTFVAPGNSSDTIVDYVPSTTEINADSITLTYCTTDNGNCLQVCDSAQYHILDIPQIDAGLPDTVCIDALPATLNASFSQDPRDPSTYTFVWGTVSGNATFSANALSTDYTPIDSIPGHGTTTPVGSEVVIYSAGSQYCVNVNDTTSVIVNPSSVVAPIPDQTVCTDATTVPISVTTTNITSGDWSTGTGATGTFSVAQDEYIVNTPNDHTNSPVTLVYCGTTPAFSGCNVVCDSFQITFQSAPVATVSVPNTACTTDLPVSVSAAGSSPGSWSATSGSFAVNTDLNTTFTAGLGTHTLTWTTTAIGSCGSFTDQADITIISGPVVYAGPDRTICQDQDTINLAGTIQNVGGTGFWNVAAGEDLGIFQFGVGTVAPNNYTFHSGNTPSVSLVLCNDDLSNCAQVCDTAVITRTPLVTIDAGINRTICGDQDTLQLFGTVSTATGGTWTTTGSTANGPFDEPDSLNPVYTWDANTVGPGDTVGTADSIKVYITSTGNGLCQPVTDSMMIFITPAPTAQAGPDDTICYDEASITLNGIVTVASQGIWTNNSAGVNVYSGGTGGGTFNGTTDVVNYFHTVEDSNTTIEFILTTSGVGQCNDVTDTMNVLIEPTPVVSVGNDTSTCADAGSFTMNGTVLNSTTGTWSASSPSGSFNGTENNIVGAVYTFGPADTNGAIIFKLVSTDNSTCFADSQTFVLTITPSVIVEAGPTQRFCATTDTVILAGFVQNAGGGTWSSLTGGMFVDNLDLGTQYIRSSTDSSSGSTTIYLDSRLEGQCLPQRDSVIINFDTIPTAFAGPDDTVCADTSGYALTGVVTQATGGHWSASVDSGFFVNADLLSTTLVLSDNDTVGAVQPLTVCLTTTGNGLCSAVTDCMELTVTPAPTVTTAIFDTVCADADSISIAATVTTATGVIWSTTNGTGTFTDSLQLTTMYHLSDLDTLVGDIRFIARTTGNGTCNSYATTLDVHITPAPSVNPGPSQTICRDVSIVTMNGSVGFGSGIWSSSDAGGVFADSSDLGTFYTHNTTDPNIPDSITITLTNTDIGSCAQISDSILVVINPIPIMNAGGFDTVCADMSTVTLGGTFANASGGVWSSPTGTNFSPSNNVGNAIYTFDSLDYVNGSVTLDWISTVTNSCNPVTDQLEITINPAPTVFANVDQLVCEDDPNISVNGNITVASGGLWTTSGGGSFGDSSQLFTSYTPDSNDINNGFVVLTLTTTGNGLCQAVSDNMILTIDPLPTLSAGFNQTLCANTDTITLNGVFSGSDSIRWSTNGFGDFSANTPNAFYFVDPLDSAAGTIQIYAETWDSIPLCNPLFDTITIVFTPVPTVSITSEATCTNNGEVTLIATYTNVTGVVWSTDASGGGSEFSGLALDTTIYTPLPVDVPGDAKVTVTTTGSGGCPPATDIDTLDIGLRADPIVDAGIIQAICADEDSVSIGTDASILNPTGSLSWISSSTGAVSYFNDSILSVRYGVDSIDIANGQVTHYLCTEDNGVCPKICDSVITFITPAPTVAAAPDVTVCADQDTVCFTGAIFTTAANVEWSTLGTGTFVDSSLLNPCYIPSTGDSIADSLQLEICTIDNGRCQQYCDTMKLYINPIPIITLTNRDTVCADIAIELDENVYGVRGPQPGYDLSVAVANATGGSWTHDGSPDSVLFFNSDSLDLRYFSSVADTSEVIGFEFCADQGNGSCEVYCDSFFLHYTPRPELSIADSALCASLDSIQIGALIQHSGGIEWTSGGDGTFADSLSDTTYYYFGDQDKFTLTAVLYAKTTGIGSCYPIYDTLVVNYTDPYFVTAGLDQNVCADTNLIQLDASYNDPIVDSIIWSSLGTGGTVFSNINDSSSTYLLDQDDLDSGYVDIVITTAVGDLCPELMDTMRITIYPLPIVDATALNACAETDTIQISGSVIDTAGMPGTGYWLTDGDGTWDPDSLTLMTNYIRGTGDSTNGTFLLTLTSDPYGQCGVVFDTLRINLIPVPQVITLDTVICKDADSIQLRADAFADTTALLTWSGGNGTFSMGDHALGVDSIYKTDSSFMTYYFNPLDTVGVDSMIIYVTNDGGSCSAVTDSIIIRFNPIPVVIAASDAACSVFDTVNLIGTIFNADSGRWSHLGAATGFLFHPDSLLNEYEPVTADTAAPATKCVDFILTSRANRGCKAYSDTTNICFTTPPDISAGTNDTVCADFPTFTLSGTIDFTASTGGLWTPDVTGGSFVNDDTDLNAVYTYPQSVISQTNDTTIMMTLTSTGNGLCPAVIDTVFLTVTHPLLASSVDTITVCGDTSAVPVQVFVNDVVDSVRWNTVNGTGTFADQTADSTSYDFSPADSIQGFATVSYTAYDIVNCVPVTDTILIIITPVPTVDAGLAEICISDAVIQLDGAITHNGVSTGNDGFWTTSSVDGSFTVLDSVANSLYTLGASEVLGSITTLCLNTSNNGLCRAYQDCLILNIIETPSADAGNDISVCGDTNMVTLNGLITTANSRWITRGTGGTFVDNLSDTTIYTISQSDSLAGCVTLVLETTFDNRGCPPGIDSLRVCVVDEPTVDAGIADTACYESTPGIPGSIHLSGSYLNAGGVEWSTVNGNSTRFDPGISGDTARYYFVPADSCGPLMFYLTTTGTGSCNPRMDSVEMFVRCVPEITANNDTTVCGDADTVQVCVAVTNATGVSWESIRPGMFVDSTQFCAQFLPDSQAVADSLVILTPSTTGTEQCQTYTESFFMYFTESPTLEAGLPQSVCSQSGDSIFLTPTVTISNAFAWTTDVGSGTFVDSSVLNATYLPGPTDSAVTVNMILMASDTVTGCKIYIDSVAITFEPAVEVSAGPRNDTVCADIGTLSLDGTILVASGGFWRTIDGDSLAFNPLPPNQDSVDYTLTDDDKIRGTVSFVLESTGNGTCLAEMDSITFIIDPAPESMAGLDDSICADAVLYGLNGGVTVTNSGVWTSTGDGTFTDSSVLNTDYFLGPTDENVVSPTANNLVFVLTSTNNGRCNPVQDVVNLTITEVPVVFAGSDRSICQDKTTIDFTSPIKDSYIIGATTTGVWTTPNGTDANFNNTTFAGMTTYTLSAADLLLGNTSGSLMFVLTSTDQGSCDPVSDTMFVQILPRPTVNVDNTPGLINDTLTICADRDTVSLVGVVTNSPTQLWSSLPFDPAAQNSFDNPVSLNPLFTVPASLQPLAGTSPTYIGLTLETFGNANGCTEVNDALILEITPEPVVNILEPDSVCADVDSVEFDATFAIATGILWGSDDNSSIFNTNTSVPTWYIPGDTDRAFGGANLTLTSTGNGSCAPVVDMLTMTITPRPTLDAGPDQIICADYDTLYLNGASVNQVVNGVQWSVVEGNNANFVDRTALQGVYLLSSEVPAVGATASTFVTFILETTDVGDCKNILDTMIVEIKPRPVVTAATGDICADLNGLEVNATFINTTGILWASNDGIFGTYDSVNTQFTPDTSVIPGIATVKVCSDGSGTCMEVCDSVDIIIKDLPDPDAGPSQIVCRNATAELIGSDLLGTGITFTWYDAADAVIGTGFAVTSPAVSVTNTMFAFEIEDNNGCITRDTMFVNPVDPPSFDMPSPYCLEDGLILSSGIDQNAVLDINGKFQWYYEGAPIPCTDTTCSSVSGPGLYWITWIAGNCTSGDTTTVAPLPVLTSMDDTICEFGTASLSTTMGYTSYSWVEVGGLGQTGVGNPFAATGIGNDSTLQSFVVTVIDSIGCQNTDSVFLSELNPPELDAFPDTTCDGIESTLYGLPLNDSVLNIDSATYIWTYEGNVNTPDTSWTGVGYDTIARTWTGRLDSGWYRISFGIANCVVEDSAYLPFHGLPETFVQDSGVFCAESDGSIVLDAGASTGSPVGHIWYDDQGVELGITTQLAEVYEEMTYQITIIDSNGCMSQDSIYVEERCPPRCHLPTAFSPDGTPCDPTCATDDDVTCSDNCFYVFCKHQKDFKLTIFNRWGEIIFYSENSGYVWDGTYLGKDMPSGLYPWTMEYNAAEEEFDRPKYVSGKILIVR